MRRNLHRGLSPFPRRVERIHSVELGTLISLHKRMTDSGGRLTLFNLSDEVYEVFTICRLHQLLEICREETWG